MMKKQTTETNCWTITSALVLVALSYVLFASSMTMWLVFLWNNHSLVHVELPLMTENREFELLLVDSALSAAFFLQHSGMVRRPFRQFLARSIDVEYHGAIYTIAASIVLLAGLVFWQKSSVIILDPKDMVLFPFVMHAIFLSAVLGFFWGTFSLKAFDVCGINPILSKLGMKDPPQPMPLSLSGPYRFVRHPYYFCCMVAFWACPSLTMDRLLYNVLWSAWLVIGTLLEERDLVRDFGEPYKDYQRTVPMLIPWYFGSGSAGKAKAKKNED